MANQQFSAIRSACALSLVTLTAVGSVFTVAAAASAPETVFSTGEVRADKSEVYNRLESGSFNVLTAHEVTVKTGSEEKKLIFGGGTVAEALKVGGITLGENQITYPAADTEIKGDCEVMVLDAKKVKLTADGKTAELMLPLTAAEKALSLAGVKLGKDDILSVERAENIAGIDELTIQRVTFKDETVSEKIPFDSVNENSDEIELGETKLKTKGVDGEKVVINRVKYIDGKKSGSKKLAEKLIKKPVDEVTLVGTKGAASAGGAGTFTDSNGVEVSYKYVLTGSGTAYTAPAGSLTATGNQVYVGGVAVNPDLIPYGSKLYVASPDGDFVYGYATAIDTGGALMDGSAIVDCFYFTYDECANFGRRDMNVYVIE